jgi:hypothetical protein
LACVASALVFVAGASSSQALAVSRTACGPSTSASPVATQKTIGLARISLNTARGVAGTQVIVGGTSWPAGRRVLINVENLIDEQGGVNAIAGLSGAIVGADGAFTAPAFSFPYLTCGLRPKAGTTATFVAVTDDNVVRVTKPFALAQTPTLTIVGQQPRILPVGAANISVVGGDWMPGVAVSFVAAQIDTTTDVGGFQRQAATPLPFAQPIGVTADARGEFEVDVPVPLGLTPGTVVNLSATATSASYGTLLIFLDPEALVPAPIPPTWDLSAPQGAPGVTLTSAGDHWWPGDEVTVEYCRIEAAEPTAQGMRCNPGPQGSATTGFAAQIGEVLVDTAGHFRATVTLPANAKPGEIIVEARLLGGNTRAAVYFASRAFTLTQPAPRTTPLLARWREWWPQALAGALMLGAALFVFWPRIMRAIGRRHAPAAPSHPTMITLEGDEGDD